MNYRLSAREDSRLAQREIGSFVWKRCRKDFASFDIDANAVDYGPIGVATLY